MDRRQAIRGGAHDLNGIDGFKQAFSFIDDDRAGIGFQSKRSFPADFLCNAAADTGKIFLKEYTEMPDRGLFHHTYEHAEFYPVRMRLDCLRFRGQGSGSPLKMHCSFTARNGVENLTMGIGDRCLANIIVNRMPPFLIGSNQFDFHPGSMRRFPVHYTVGDYLWGIFPRVDLDFVVMGRFSGACPGSDND